MKLTRAQRRVAALVAYGLLDKQIAQELGTTVSTVKKHVGAVATRWELDRARNLRVQIARRVFTTQPLGKSP